MRQPVPTRCDVIPFLRKRAERAHAQFASLYSSERTEAEVLEYVRALTDYSRENFRKGSSGKASPTADEEAEILSRMQEITGPPEPLPPEIEAVVQRFAQPEVWRELREILHDSNATD